ncbi:MAG: Spo0E family sporulation regulatory protein-aspartic acid phosphatase [Clostridiales bacterium]|nr:Spo0E family sporulation regulatory protein-aspartic acid phosphatase [Clostridiales bacterium]
MAVKELKQEKKSRVARDQVLLEEMMAVRNKLNKKIYRNGNRLVGADILELSKQLDKLIVEYLDLN